MKLTLSLALLMQPVTARLGSRSAACQADDLGVRAVLEAKLANLAVPCEDMCREMGAYPNCQCPGFAGQPASADDTRACYEKYCQGTACPSDAFVGCVKELTKVSVLQWSNLLSHLDLGSEVYKKTLGKLWRH
eukprot:TRINITY_DN12646_c0_g1_i2.p1 TRINITY_DN12646_c0_g1~~TRINITY_DN12646_c0_g1_i2.p1  ORF type:complete len:148 (-),score=23.02 TRINITY_DN12646_c0_g1_i2:338-736(-)